MYRLIDRSKTPPRGFIWIDPITTLQIEARNYANWRAKACEHRAGNAYPVPSEEEMEDQLCDRFDPKTRQRICQQYEDTGPVKALGVGGTLKDLLARIGVNACWGCINLAKKMDDWGPEGCEEHMAEIVETMNDNASKRNWYKFVPFKEAGSELLVRFAINTVRERR